MDKRQNEALSRRQCLTVASLPVIAAALGSNLLAAPDNTDEKLLGARVYNVRDFGAKGDGTSLDTAAVQSAIDQCNRDHGGTVLVPGGDFVVGTLELKSNVTLHLAAAGKLLGSPKIEDYHAGNGIPRSNGNIVMVSAADADNVTIEGRGTIDGNGAKFFTGHGDNTGPGQNSSQGYFQRPHLMVFYKCRNLLIRDAFLTASAYHCCRILQCRYVKLEGVRIHNRVNMNNDGFHINSSEYVNIVNCNVACQDDACALFGSNKFVTVTNSSFSTRWSCFRFGGGNPENITVSNCIIYETYGCAIKMRFGARNSAQNMIFSNLIMTDVTGPISIGLDASRRPSTTTTSDVTTSRGGSPGSTTTTTQATIRNITFTNIRATVVALGKQHADLPFESHYRPGETRSCIVINGAHETDVIENISFTDVHITYDGGGTAEEANREVPKMAGEYFEIGTPPAYGLYARNARGLTLDNVRFDTLNPDLRPALILDGVEDAVIANLTARASNEAEAVVRALNSREVLFTSPRVIGAAKQFLQLDDRSNVRIDGRGNLPA